MQTITN